MISLINYPSFLGPKFNDETKGLNTMVQKNIATKEVGMSNVTVAVDIYVTF